jgi:hypothetical protein
MGYVTCGGAVRTGRRFQWTLLVRRRVAVAILTGLRAAYPTNRGLIPGRGHLGPTQPTIRWVLEIFSLGMKRPGHKANDILICGAGDKNV